MKKDLWAKNFMNQWELIEKAAENIGCKHLLHIWPDRD